MRKFNGFAKLSVDGCGEIESNYTLILKDNGKTSIIFNITPVYKDAVPMLNKFNENGVLFGDLIGEIDVPGATIESKQLAFNAFNFYSLDSLYDIQIELRAFHPIKIDFNSLSDKDDIEIRYGLTNFLFFGHEVTERNGTFSRDTIKISVNGREIRITHLEKYREIEKRFRDDDKVQVTSEMIVNTKYSDLSEVDMIADNFNIICSYASANWVTDTYQDIFKDGKIARTIIKPLKTYPYSPSLSSIDSSIRGNRELESFLTTAYPEYVKLKDELGLDIVIEYYISAHGSRILELSFLLGAITFECIDSYLQSYFAKKGIKKDLNTFKKKTRALIEEFGVVYAEDELSFVKTRNSIVHSGRFPSGKKPIDEVHSLINLLDRCLLSILGYKGNNYYNRKSNSKEIL